MSQFRTRAEAQQAIQDMERREARSREALEACGHREARFNLRRSADEYRAEAARIRAILPTLPE